MGRTIFICFIFTFFTTICPISEARSPKKVLNWRLYDDLPTLDSAMATTFSSVQVISLSAECLYQYSYQKTPVQIEPLLAEDLPQISADKLTYTIKIKKGVYFQDDPSFPNGKGRELKAHDFIYSWKRLFDPRVQSPRRSIFEGRILGIDEFKNRLLQTSKEKLDEAFTSPVEGLKALDDYTLMIRLVSKYPQFPKMLAYISSAPVPYEAVKYYGNSDFSQHMVGTGPYILASYHRGSKLVMKKNPKFRGELFRENGSNSSSNHSSVLPFLDEIQFHIIKEENPAWLHFLRGNIDVYGVSKDSFETAIQNGELSSELKGKGVILKKKLEPTLVSLTLSMKNPVLGSNLLLRKAISKAINRDEWIKILLNGNGIKATSLIPPGIPGRIERTHLVGDYNLKEAKQLLTQAGFPNGKGLPPIYFETSGFTTTVRQQSELLVRSLREIGIHLSVKANTAPLFMSKIDHGNFDTFLGGLVATFPDPENFLKLGYGKPATPSYNESNWKNAEFDQLYEKIAAMSPSPERIQLIDKAEMLLLEDAVVLPMYYPVSYILQQKWIKNFFPENHFALNFIKYLDLE